MRIHRTIKRQGHCERGECDFEGELIFIDGPPEVIQAARGHPAGQRWYCGECVTELITVTSLPGSTQKH